MFEFYKELYKFKNLQRKGWLLRGCADKETNRVESDAEHSFSMCMLALEIINKENLKLNTEKVLKMCLYHDLGEIDTGDITPVEDVTKQEKHENELNCINRISTTYNMTEIKEIWLEYESQQTSEAKFVKIIDKLDAVSQSKVYANMLNKQHVFDEFYKRALPIIKDFIKYI